MLDHVLVLATPLVGASILFDHYKKEGLDKCRVLLFWIPLEIKILGRSKFALAEILGPLGLRIYGALAPRPRRAVLFAASILFHHHTSPHAYVTCGNFLFHSLVESLKTWYTIVY